MASRSLGVLTLDLLLKIGGFQKGMDAAARTSEKRLREIKVTATKVGAAIGTALVAAAGAATYAIKQSIDRMDELSKASQKIGVTTEALSRLSYAADLSDVSLEQLQAGLAKLTKYQAEAAQGGKEAVATFKAFGVEVRDNAGHLRDTQSVLQDWARIFAALPDGPEKTALALRVFGKAGAELIPLLNGGADGLRKMAAEADALGLTVSTQAGRQAEEFNDTIRKLELQLTGMATQISIGVLPELVKLANALQGIAADGSKGFDFVDFATEDLSELSKSIRHVAVEIEFLKKAWKEQGVFGEGIFSVLKRAREEFERREALSQGLAIHGGPVGRGTARKGAEQGRTEREAGEAAKTLLATTAATDGKSEADKKAKEAARRHAEALEQLQDELEKARVATVEFTGKLEDLVAQQGGPLAESALKYRREEEEIRKLWAEGSAPAAEDLAKALDSLHAARDAEAESIRKSLDTGGERLKQLQNELDLIGKKTIAERDRAAFLQDNPTATSEQADAAARIRQQIDETRKLIDANDEVRASFEDAFINIWDDGIKGVERFFDSIIQQLIRTAAQSASLKLFGEPGTSGGGLLGGFVNMLFGGASAGGGGSNFGIPLPGSGLLPGFATGTDFAPGGLSWVGEHGKELVRMPRGAQVVPNHRLAEAGVGGGIELTQNFYQPVDERTADQAAKRGATAQRRAMARNGR